MVFWLCPNCFVVRVACPAVDRKIQSVAICAGAGASLFTPSMDRSLADLYFTGEAGHHFALDVTARGSYLLAVEHSRSERGYLAEVLLPLLQAEFPGDIFVVSEADTEPYQLK